jgi:IS5 family transposase
MYRRVELPPTPPENFQFPVEPQLDPNNRWVIMAKLMPWSEFEEEYAQKFSTEMGAPAKTFRIALGALIIKEKLGTSDNETVEQIKENPYLQYFLGMSAYSNEAPFEASMLTHFRKRISVELVNEVNRKMVSNNSEITREETPSESEESRKATHRGKLIIDATCAPADIRYPTDLELLNQAREELEEILDSLYEPIQGKVDKKPRSYRKKAREDYLEITFQRRPSRKKRRKAIKKQLQYIQRDLGHIEQLIAQGASLEFLSNRQYKMLLVVTEVYRQQLWMYKNNKKRIDDRIVSLSQPHIRPIVRGKVGKPVEFGAKLSVSYIDGYIFIDRVSWDNFNESGDFKKQVEEFKRYTGYYPESVHVDRIYRTRENRAFCKEKGIRMSGSPLGRPAVNISKEEKKQALEDERVRNSIEGKFGQAKRKFSLNQVMTKLPSTSETAIGITFLAINISRLLRQANGLFLCLFQKSKYFRLFLSFGIKKSYACYDYSKQNLSC